MAHHLVWRLLTEGTIKACWRFAAGDCDAMADEPSKRSPLPNAEIKADHPAVDLAAALLRAFGQYGIATEKLPAEQLQQRCDQWARHLLVGSPPPGAAGVGTAISKREWDGARRFFVDARRSEQEFVNARIGDFRDMLWVFIHGLRAVPFAFAYGGADPGRTRRRRSHQQLAGPLITALLQLFGRQFFGGDAILTDRAQQSGRELHSRVVGLEFGVGERRSFGGLVGHSVTIARGKKPACFDCTFRLQSPNVMVGHVGLEPTTIGLRVR